MLGDEKMGVRDLPDVSLLLNGQILGELQQDALMAKAPPFVRDELLFPYLGGTVFTQQFLKANSGWADFRKVFENPPVSTQQILHPELYLSGVKPAPVILPDLKALVPSGWKILEENVLGEFGLQEVLKQFLGEERGEQISPAWAGDRYVIFENEKTKQTLLVFRLRLDTAANAARFFGHYSEVLELKYKNRSELFRRPNFFQFQTDRGGVFFRCLASQCLAVEGGSRDLFDKVGRALDWPAAPAPAVSSSPNSQVTAAIASAILQ
jgi:hypothetical protein